MPLMVTDPVAQAFTAAIRAGNLDALAELLVSHPGLARETVVTPSGPAAGERSALHLLTDWPGPARNGPAMVAALVGAGASVAARFVGSHRETPLHWAASCDDVPTLLALLDAGAEIDASGGVLADGTPLDDAVAFAQWEAARNLVARGATVKVEHAAALGLSGPIEAWIQDKPAQADLDRAYWFACHGAQSALARTLLLAGARPNVPGPDGTLPAKI
jgi:ankyrin repeat protein